MRLCKKIAQSSGLSRRQAEQAIAEGRVRLNGILVTTPCHFVKEEDVIAVDNILLDKPSRPCLWAVYKPENCLVTREDPRGRPTLFDVCCLPPSVRHIYVGRLDYHSQGLILLTNTPRLAHILETSGWKRRYYVETTRPLPRDTVLDNIRKGTCIDGIFYKPCVLTPLSKTSLHITLVEGKNREIRLLLGSLGLTVKTLLRLSFGPFSLGNLQKGAYRTIPFSSFDSFLSKQHTKDIAYPTHTC